MAEFGTAHLVDAEAHCAAIKRHGIGKGLRPGEKPSEFARRIAEANSTADDRAEAAFASLRRTG